MTHRLLLGLVGFSGLVLGVLLGISAGTLTTPSDSVVQTQPSSAAKPETRAAGAGPSTAEENTTRIGRDRENAQDPDTATLESRDTKESSPEEPGSEESSVEEPSVEELARRGAIIDSVAEAVVAVESFGCEVGVKATGVSLDRSTVVVPSLVHDTSWYVAVDGTGLTFPQLLVVDDTHPAVAANTARSIADSSVPLGQAAVGDQATILWADEEMTVRAVGTVEANSAAQIELSVMSAVPAHAIGGAVVNDEGALVGLIEAVSGSTVTARPIEAVTSRPMTEPRLQCTKPSGPAVIYASEAFDARARPEITALLAFQLEEDHLSDGDYDLAQAMDATLAKLSRDQMVRGWSVTADSFVVPVRWSTVGDAIEWKLGLVTHETNQTSKLFCVTRTYDNRSRTVTRTSKGSSLVFEGRSGWLQPTGAIDEIEASC